MCVCPTLNPGFIQLDNSSWHMDNEGFSIHPIIRSGQNNWQWKPFWHLAACSIRPGEKRVDAVDTLASTLQRMADGRECKRKCMCAKIYAVYICGRLCYFFPETYTHREFCGDKPSNNPLEVLQICYPESIFNPWVKQLRTPRRSIISINTEGVDLQHFAHWTDDHRRRV